MRLETKALGVRLQNPFFLASGTCGFGLELAEVLDIEALGGFVTKSVTLEPRVGNLRREWLNSKVECSTPSDWLTLGLSGPNGKSCLGFVTISIDPSIGKYCWAHCC
ncbi:MAG: hypothetical protein CM1200mP14_28000 [Gammaproteobacteria bacterium]|nr:MAG: hypothetical protein CM1200mP14_28000 [Gammaproteobacteria bacterium]